LGGTIDWHTLHGEGTEVTIDVPLFHLARRDGAPVGAGR
jgi:acetyltransferase-like isoleucine patch superfamily enzyme